jgi:hypothetical protein
MLDQQDYDLGDMRSTPAVAQVAQSNPKPLTAKDWFKVIGPRIADAIKPFQCGAPWTAFAKDCELRRLARLQARIDRKQRALSELKADRRQIMVRCVRRMRRERGLQS